MVAVSGGRRTLSHLYFQCEAQRLRCSGPGVGNGKRSAEIHYEVPLEAGALYSTMCLGMQEIIGTHGKAESEASSWGKMVSALVNYL